MLEGKHDEDVPKAKEEEKKEKPAAGGKKGGAPGKLPTQQP